MLIVELNTVLSLKDPDFIIKMIFNRYNRYTNYKCAE